MHGSEHVILSVGEQKEENTEPDDFAVQVVLLDLQFREGGQGVEDGVGKPGIVINDPVGCQENGGGGRGDNDGENHLRELLCDLPVQVIPVSLFAVGEERIEAGPADGDAQGMVVGQRIAS